jgi:hypothetical protein
MRPSLLVLAALAAIGSAGFAAQRAGAFGESRDHPAIDYSKGAESTAVTRLNEQLERGAATLTFEPGRGYLRGVLAALDIPVSSQVLVYSETSFQARLINQSNPRAVYFNDRAAVGWVRGGSVLEVAAQDPRQGTIFYSLPQTETATPRLARSDACLSCHLSWETMAVPGLFVLSVLPRASDRDYANGSHVDHRSPIEERWGGWYVTGQKVPPSLANARMLQPDLHTRGPERVPAKRSLEGTFDLSNYLAPYSDVAALMVLEHQTRGINLLTRVGWESRVAQGADAPALGVLPPRVEEALNDLVDYLLFVDEPTLQAPIVGSSGFAAEFAAVGPRDRKGRSLRELQLTTRLMKYPLSYLIDSEQFAALPDLVRRSVWRRIDDVLEGRDKRPKFAHLSAMDRAAIREIAGRTSGGPP